MTSLSSGRMLLSHNFNISEDVIPSLNREEFTHVFQEKLQQYPSLQCRQLKHSHWMVEILFPSAQFSPSEVGEICADALLEKRQTQIQNNTSFPDILILGGCKKTPPTSDHPETLKTGEWGIDVVETTSAQDFLDSIEWDTKTDGKTIDQVFKIERLSN